MTAETDVKVLLGIDHPAIAAEDVDALSEWYVETLGYEKVFRHDKPVWLLRAADGTLLEVMPRDDTPRPERTTWTPGWSHIAIRVSNFEQAQAHLDQKGVQWTGAEMNAIGGGRVRNFVDPEGNMLQILERPTT
ncbi:MAG: VOC family protein [Planctomycetaceae bacterium]|jgi:glyoxylase I family protein|nr:VOC family protein [Planctomycetaceae bacterium]